MKNIDDRFLRNFFEIDESPEGDGELAEIRKKLVEVSFEHGDEICGIDSEPDGIYFLESGTAEVLGRDGVQVNILHEGQYFGEYAVLAHQKRLSTVRSLGRTVCYRLSTDDTMEILSRHKNLYGELLRRVYGQLSGKHGQLVEFSRMQRGVLLSPDNMKPMTKKGMLLQYGILAILFAAAAFFIPVNTEAPVFIVPLALMFVYALVTKRTIESLIVSCLMALMLLRRCELLSGFADTFMDTMSLPDNVFTVFVMALMGSAVSLIEASGSITAFKKLVDGKVRSGKGAMLSAFGIMAATSIDDCLNVTCASEAVKKTADDKRVPHERMSLLMSFLPTVLTSFIPLSLWGIFVIGTVSVYCGGAVGLVSEAIPFNFYSITVVIAMLALCLGILPRNRELKAADRRAAETGKLWPDGSERYIIEVELGIWGRIRNLVLPILVYTVTSFVLRSVNVGSFAVDSACGLLAAMVFMFFFYGAQGLMSPDRFIDCAVNGIREVILPIILYLLTTCFSTLLEGLSMGSWFDRFINMCGGAAWSFPVVLFVICSLLTTVLGSSWSMFPLAFPVAVKFGAGMTGIGLPLCIGAVMAAGIAGEKNCALTDDALNVAGLAGCRPECVGRLRIYYSMVFTGITAVLYLAAGVLFTAL